MRFAFIFALGSFREICCAIFSIHTGVYVHLLLPPLSAQPPCRPRLPALQAQPREHDLLHLPLMFRFTYTSVVNPLLTESSCTTRSAMYSPEKDSPTYFTVTRVPGARRRFPSHFTAPVWYSIDRFCKYPAARAFASSLSYL